MEVSTYFTTITPEEAKLLLEKNYENNRTLKPSVVRKYAMDMAEGRWNEYAADPIALTSDMKILNGQHRLAAVVKANVPLYTEVRCGVPEDAYRYFDCGVNRTAADGLPKEVTHKTAVAAACRLAFNIGNQKNVKGAKSFNSSSGNVTSACVFEYFKESEEKYPGKIQQACNFAYKKEVAATKWGPRAISISAYAMLITDERMFKEFEKLILAKNSPTYSVTSFKTWALRHDLNNFSSDERSWICWCAAANVWRMLHGLPDKEFRRRKNMSGELIGFETKLFNLIENKEKDFE